MSSNFKWNDIETGIQSWCIRFLDCRNKWPWLGSFNQQKFILLQFWKLAVWDQGVSRTISLRSQWGGALPCLSRLLVFSGLWQRHCNLHLSSHDLSFVSLCLSLPWWLSGKECACQSWRCGFHSGLEQSPGEGNRIPLQYSCLENPMDRGIW